VRAFLAESIRSLGLPTILVTHDANDVEALASRVAVLEKGRVAGCGLLADILRIRRLRLQASCLIVESFGCRRNGRPLLHWRCLSQLK